LFRALYRGKEALASVIYGVREDPVEVANAT
jgi:hypothetical protein